MFPTRSPPPFILRFDLYIVDHKPNPIDPAQVAENLRRVGLQPIEGLFIHLAYALPDHVPNSHFDFSIRFHSTPPTGAENVPPVVLVCVARTIAHHSHHDVYMDASARRLFNLYRKRCQ